MKAFLLAAVAGGLFAIGLAVGGMTVPAKITGFLDVAGAWDPSLMFVMAAAIAVYAPLLRIMGPGGPGTHRPAPLASDRFHLPVARAIDARLVGGAAIFGVGWGLSGYCPGPALASLAGCGTGALVFVAAMIGGTVLTRSVTRT